MSGATSCLMSLSLLLLLFCCCAEAVNIIGDDGGGRYVRMSACLRVWECELIFGPL